MYRHFVLVIFQITIVLVARTSSSATCQNNILRFSQTGAIEASTTEAVTGESITVTCTSKCAWQWHKFTVNNDPVPSADQSSPDGHQYSINSVFNSIANCSNCYIPSQQNCSDSNQGPVKSTLNMTFASSGVYYFQCRTSLYQFNTPYWPNNVIDVYSKILQIHVHDSSSPSVTSMGVLPSSSVPAVVHLTSLMLSHTSNIPTTTPAAPSNTAAISTSSPPSDPFYVTVTVTVTDAPSFVTVTTATTTSSVTVSSSIRERSPLVESTSLSVDIGRASKDGCDSGGFTDTTVAIIILSVFCGLLLLTTVALAIALCCHTIKSPKGIEHYDCVMDIQKSSSSPPSVTGDSDTSSIANKIERMESSV